MDVGQLKSAKTVEQLATQFGYSYASLSSIVYGSPGQSYRTFQIAKRSGGYRTIAAPRPELRAIQRNLLEALTQAYHPTRSAFGFVRGRSIVSGARRHVGRLVVVNIDLSDFFDSITFWRVRGLFMSAAFQLPYDVATVLAQICCRNGRLPQGAPTSPILSNFVCSSMDRELGSLVGACGGRYSRYCDDMTMSFNSENVAFKSIIKREASGLQLNVSVEKIIQKNGFSINYSKLKLRTKRERQEVTGLVVNERVNVRRQLVRRLHTQLHCIEKYGLIEAARRNCEIEGIQFSHQSQAGFAAGIRGRILFIKMVRGDGDAVFANLAKRFNRLDIYPQKIKYYRRVESAKSLEHAAWVVEVSYDDSEWGYCFSQGTAFTLDGLGIVTCAHVVVNEKSRRPFREIEIFRVGSPIRYRAFVASFNPKTDLAILFVEELNYLVDCDVRLKLSPTSGLIGQEVQLVGFPNYRVGQSLFAAKTEIAALHGSQVEVGSQVIGGISGGPLLDMDFRVVGVLTRGIIGGGAKNEAIKAEKAFQLNFRFQDLSILDAERHPIVATHGFWRQLMSRIKGVFRVR